MKVESYEVAGVRYIRIRFRAISRILELKEARDLWAQLGGALWLADGEPDTEETPTQVICQKIFKRFDEMSEIARDIYKAQHEGNLTAVRDLEQADIRRLVSIERLAVLLAQRVYGEEDALLSQPRYVVKSYRGAYGSEVYHIVDTHNCDVLGSGYELNKVQAEVDRRNDNDIKGQRPPE